MILEDISFGPMDNFLFPKGGGLFMERDSNVIIHAVSQPTSTASLHNAYKCEKKKRIQKNHLLPFL